MRHTTRTLLYLGLAVSVAGLTLLGNAALEGLRPAANTDADNAARHFAVAAGAAAAIFGLAAIAGLVRRHFEALDTARDHIAMSVAGGVTELPRPDTPVSSEVAALYDVAQALVTSRSDRQGTAEERLAAILATVPQAIVVVTETGLVSLINGAARGAFAGHQVAVGTSVFDALSRGHYEAALNRAKASGETISARIETAANGLLDLQITALHEDTGAILVFDPGDTGHGPGLHHDMTLHDRPPPTGPITEDTSLRDLPICVFDSETTGLDIVTDAIISMGGIRMHGMRLYPELTVDVLVDPGRAIPESSTRVHGITDDMVAGAPDFAAIWPQVAALMQDTVVVGHNISFDLAMIRRAMTDAGLEWTPPPALDTMLLLAGLEPREKDLTLDTIAARFGVGIRGRHTAFGDALVTAEIMQRLIPRLEASAVHTLGQAMALARRPKRIIAAQKNAGWLRG